MTDTDKTALEAARQIMAVIYGPMPLGGSVQLQAMVQEIVTDAMRAAAEQDKLDAARYRVLRQHVAPRDLCINMRVPCLDLPDDETIESRIDSLCDAAMLKVST